MIERGRLGVCVCVCVCERERRRERRREKESERERSFRVCKRGDGGGTGVKRSRYCRWALVSCGASFTALLT